MHVDTEMNAEVEPSLETERRLAEEAAAERRRRDQLTAIQADQRRAAEAAAQQQRDAEAAAARLAAEAEAVRKVQTAPPSNCLHLTVSPGPATSCCHRLLLANILFTNLL